MSFCRGVICINLLIFTLLSAEPAKTSVSPRSSPLGTSPAAKSEEKRMFSQAIVSAVRNLSPVSSFSLIGSIICLWVGPLVYKRTDTMAISHSLDSLKLNHWKVAFEKITYVSTRISASGIYLKVGHDKELIKALFKVNLLFALNR